MTVENGVAATEPSPTMTPLRLAASISKRHAAAFRLLTVEQVATMRDGMRARAELPKVLARVEALEAVLKVLDEKAK